MKVSCSFTKKCQNYPKMCDKCIFNAEISIGNYLKFKDGKTIVRYLEDSE